MEVHSHHNNERKKWTHYLWEFLMLFLAVFCGFLAENQRERMVDHRREKEYIHSIVEDIKSDTAQSNEVLKKLNKTILGLDSLMEELASNTIVTNSNNAYRLWNKYIGFADFVSNNRTIQQLKSSGAMRLIRNKPVSDSIMKYDQTVSNFQIQADLLSHVLSDQTMYYRIFDFIRFNKTKIDSVPVPLTEEGRKFLNQAFANRKLWKYGLSVLINRLRDVNEEGKIIVTFIKKQYNLD